VEERVKRLEDTTARHDEQIAKLFSQMSDMNSHFDAIDPLAKVDPAFVSLTAD